MDDEHVPEEVRKIPDDSAKPTGISEPTGLRAPPSNGSNDRVERRYGGDWAGVTSWQVKRAAWLISRILDFKERMDQ